MNLKYLAFCFIVLFTGGLISAYFAIQPISPQDIASNLSQNLEEELQKVDAEAAVMLPKLKSGENLFSSVSSEYFFFLFDGLRLLSWSNNAFVPS
ncbi:MAG TPA: hypothetical protein VJ184_13490, partial [Chryseolinea sp.]|nr:hypothetical protein [Chryseolinea sp.]